MKPIVLMPYLSGDLYKIAKSKKHFFMVDLNRAIQRIKRHHISKIFVVTGAKNQGKIVTARGVYRTLKKAFKKIDVKVIDTFDWGIKGQCVLSGHSLAKTLKTALSES